MDKSTNLVYILGYGLVTPLKSLAYFSNGQIGSDLIEEYGQLFCSINMPSSSQTPLLGESRCKPAEYMLSHAEIVLHPIAMTLQQLVDPLFA